MTSFHLDAPAKVNLGLRIVGRRNDGYHELESLFVPLDLADGLGMRVERADAADVSLRLGGDTDGVPTGPDNLVQRAARAFLDAAGITAEVEIALTKHTPVAAGLGGGSSDAAAVLRGLARAFPDALQAEEVAALALSLGADVPYFLDPRPAWVTGVGERCELVAGLPVLHLLLVNPGTALSTAEVYRAYDALAPASALPDAAVRSRPTLPKALRSESLAALLGNDLEPAAVRLCPAIARLRERLRAVGARGVGLSGSGATLFGVFADAEAARDAGARLALALPAWSRVAATRESG